MPLIQFNASFYLLSTPILLPWPNMLTTLLCSLRCMKSKNETGSLMEAVGSEPWELFVLIEPVDLYYELILEDLRRHCIHLFSI